MTYPVASSPLAIDQDTIRLSSNKARLHLPRECLPSSSKLAPPPSQPFYYSGSRPQTPPTLASRPILITRNFDPDSIPFLSSSPLTPTSSIGGPFTPRSAVSYLDFESPLSRLVIDLPELWDSPSRSSYSIRSSRNSLDVRSETPDEMYGRTQSPFSPSPSYSPAIESASISSYPKYRSASCFEYTVTPRLTMPPRSASVSALYGTDQPDDSPTNGSASTMRTCRPDAEPQTDISDRPSSPASFSHQHGVRLPRSSLGLESRPATPGPGSITDETTARDQKSNSNTAGEIPTVLKQKGFGKIAATARSLSRKGTLKLRAGLSGRRSSHE